jgi:hypothetical protein
VTLSLRNVNPRSLCYELILVNRVDGSVEEQESELGDAIARHNSRCHHSLLPKQQVVRFPVELRFLLAVSCEEIEEAGEGRVSSGC